MYKKIMSLLAVAFAMVFGVSAASTPPVVVDNGDTTAEGIAIRGAAPAADTTTQVDITLVPFEGSPRFNPAFAGLVAKAISVVRATGTLPMGSPTNLTDPRLINHIRWDSIMTTPSGVTYWAGFNPSGSFAGANGKTVWVLVRAKSKTGANDVSLSMVSAALRSQDGGNNSLGQDVTFLSNSYTDLSPGWRADGGTVTTGSSSQMVAELVVVVGFKSYQVSNQNEVQNVMSYVVGDFAITFTATAGASSKVLTLSLIPPTPRLFIHNMDGVVHLGAETNGNAGTYVVQVAPTLTGPWTSGTNIVAGQTIAVSGIADAQFFRLMP
jgi:hypothetical protein